MTDQNSGEMQQVSGGAETLHPEQVMDLLGIKKQAYYDRTKFLGVKAAKDNQGKAYLTQMQFELMQRLDQHIKESGTMDGFIVGRVEPEGSESGELALAQPSAGLANESSELAGEMPPVQPTEEFQPGIDEQLIRMAAELKTQQLIATPEIVRAIATQMTEEDLPDDLRSVVQNARESVAPKFQPAQVASQMLNQWRSRQSGNQTVIAS